jgi:hypothetical protein
MLNQHPITPPPELLDEWCMDPTLSNWRDIAARAAQWGADQQLEATDTWIRTEMKDRQRPVNRIADDHRADMRPKPPSLKEQALAVIENSAICDHLSPQDAAIIRRALEALD